MRREIIDTRRKVVVNFVQRPQHLLLSKALHHRVAEPDRAEHRGVRRHYDHVDSKLLGHGTGVLPTRAAERHQCVVRWVVAATN